MRTSDCRVIKSAVHYEPVTIDPLIGDIPKEKTARKTFFATWADFFSQLSEGDTEGASNRFMEAVYELKTGGYSHEKEITKELFRQNARTLPVMFNPEYRKTEGITCDFLRKTKVPTMIVHGGKTNQYWSLMAKKFAECTPNAILKVMEGVNHKAPIEDFDTFSGLIVDFVEEHK